MRFISAFYIACILARMSLNSKDFERFSLLGFGVLIGQGR